MKISGTGSTIIFDLENGYVLKAQGELFINKKFVVYKDSMTKWLPPFENKLVTSDDVESIIKIAKSMENGETMSLEFV